MARADPARGGTVSAYYNEIDPYCVEWLRNLMDAGVIADGVVDSRRIQEVKPEDVREYRQCHFFAGLGGWAYATRLAGWPDDRPIWTGSCPCQPFSNAGRGKGFADPRHLWPDFHRLICGTRPVVVMGEQTSAKAGYAWFDRVEADLAAEAYSCRAVDIPACSVNAPHIRNRLYWVADTTSVAEREPQHKVSAVSRNNARAHISGSVCGLGGMDDATSPRCSEARPDPMAEVRNGARWSEPERRGSDGEPGRLVNTTFIGRREGRPEHELRSGRAATASAGFWDEWGLVGPDPEGKFRRVKPGVRLLASGVPARVAKLRAFGNAIVPEIAAEVIRAYIEAERSAL
jgi:DNA (cytosine-5)-methyltransferase 1